MILDGFSSKEIKSKIEEIEDDNKEDEQLEEFKIHPV